MESNTRYNPDTGGKVSEPQGVGSLVSGVIEDLQSLVRSEVQLAKTEIKEDVQQIGAGAGMLAGGALIGVTGFIFLMLGVTYLLNKAVEMWLAAGIVGIALLAIAAIVAMNGKNKLSAANLKPEQTIETMKENKEWANRQIKSATK